MGVWFHTALSVGRSDIAGQGLIATELIPADTIVLRLGGRLVTTVELHNLIAIATPAGRYVDTITVDDDAHLILPPDTAAHFANHHCDPSMWHIGAYELATRRVIEPGDELTVDYGTNSGDASFFMDCACGSSVCRGSVTGEDWRRYELQTRYAGHWVPGLARRIEQVE